MSTYTRYDSQEAFREETPEEEGVGARRAADLAAIDIVTVLQALSDPVRLEIVRQLAGCIGAGKLRCGQIELPVSKSTTSHHLKTLTSAGLIAEREAGTRKYLRLRRSALEQRFPGLIDAVLRAAGSA